MFIPFTKDNFFQVEILHLVFFLSFFGGCVLKIRLLFQQCIGSKVIALQFCYHLKLWQVEIKYQNCVFCLNDYSPYQSNPNTSMSSHLVKKQRSCDTMVVTRLPRAHKARLRQTASHLYWHIYFNFKFCSFFSSLKVSVKKFTNTFIFHHKFIDLYSISKCMMIKHFFPNSCLILKKVKLH